MAEASTPKKPVKILLFNRRLDGLTDEEFHNHWRTIHAQLVRKTPMCLKKIKRYVQLHSSPANRAKAAELGTDALQFDGCAEIWVDSIEDWEELLADPEFQKIIPPDSASFGKQPLGMLFGQEEHVIGEPVKLG